MRDLMESDPLVEIVVHLKKGSHHEEDRVRQHCVSNLQLLVPEWIRNAVLLRMSKEPYERLDGTGTTVVHIIGVGKKYELNRSIKLIADNFATAFDLIVTYTDGNTVFLRCTNPHEA